LPLLFGSSGHVGFPMLKTSLFINTKYYAMCGSNDGHTVIGLEHSLIERFPRPASLYLCQERQMEQRF
jgi:hypothetical protein